MSDIKMNRKYYDYQDLMDVAEGSYVQGQVDGFSRVALDDVMENEELYDYLAWKYAGDGYTVEEIIEREGESNEDDIETV